MPAAATEAAHLDGGGGGQLLEGRRDLDSDLLRGDEAPRAHGLEEGAGRLGPAQGLETQRAAHVAKVAQRLGAGLLQVEASALQRRRILPPDLGAGDRRHGQGRAARAAQVDRRGACAGPKRQQAGGAVGATAALRGWR